VEAESHTRPALSRSRLVWESPPAGYFSGACALFAARVASLLTPKTSLIARAQRGNPDSIRSKTTGAEFGSTNSQRQTELAGRAICAPG
jgi:hypothetical protein